jgi:predicted transcriptional regulator
LGVTSRVELLRELAARRRPLAAALRDEGYSTRAIADMLHASQTAVVRDLRVSGAGIPERVLGLDGKTYRFGA